MQKISKNVILTVILFITMFSILKADRRIITSLKYSKHRVKTTIINGTSAPEGKFPYLVSIKTKITDTLWKNICGGSIIKPTTVLTAAHCFELNNFYLLRNTKILRIVAGSLVNILMHRDNSTNKSNEQWRKIRKVILHTDFNFPLNDIALVFVNAPFIYTSVVNYAVPARRVTDYSGPCFSAGFGRTGGIFPSSKLLWGEIHIMSRKQCRFIWDMYMDRFICSRSILADIAIGDSGGPLICPNTQTDKENDDHILVGVVCGKNYDKTSLFTRVPSYIDWIERNGSEFHSFNIVFLYIVMSKYILLCLNIVCVLYYFVIFLRRLSKTEAKCDN